MAAACFFALITAPQFSPYIESGCKYLNCRQVRNPRMRTRKSRQTEQPSVVEFDRRSRHITITNCNTTGAFASGVSSCCTIQDSTLKEFRHQKNRQWRRLVRMQRPTTRDNNERNLQAPPQQEKCPRMVPADIVDSKFHLADERECHEPLGAYEQDSRCDCEHLVQLWLTAVRWGIAFPCNAPDPEGGHD